MDDDKNNAAELDVGNENGEYKVEAIWDSAVYARESKLGHLLGFYYLVLCKGYPKEENTWKPASAVHHLKKLISLFYKDHPDKPTVTLPTINNAPPMARRIVKLYAKQKRKQLTGYAKKQRVKWDDKEEAIRRNLSQCGSKS